MTPAEATLAAQVAEGLRAALLPVDPPFAEDALAEAARFLAATASARAPGEAAVAIETVTGPVGERRMRFALVNDDMPFLVDSVAMAIAAHRLPIDRLVHPVIDLGGVRQSLIYVETPRADARTRARLRLELEATLAAVRAAVTDWPAMRAAMAADADACPDPEGAALLRWLADGALTQLGHVRIARDGTFSQPLGVCRAGGLDLAGPPLLGPLSTERSFARFDAGGVASLPEPLVVKSNRLSCVHRRVPYDLFIAPERGADGGVTALSVHAGTWTSAALAAPPAEVPRLRAQLDGLAARFGFDPRGHAGKALVHALTVLPHDLLVSFEEADVARVAATMISLVDRPRPRLSLVVAPLRRHLFAFVWLPRDAISTALRLQVADLLVTAAGAQVLDWSLAVEEGNLALLRFVLDIRDGADLPDETALDLQLQTLVRGWTEAVEAELAPLVGAARAAAVAARYADAFPQAYRAASGPAEAARDIERLRRLAGDPGDPRPRRDARLHCPGGCPGDGLRLKLYQRGGPLALSDAVPLLENFGFRVLGEAEALLAEGRLGAIHDFDLRLPAGVDPDGVLARADEVEAAVAAVLNGEAEDDPFNRLVAATGLAAREAHWLRAFYRYLRQAGLGFGIATVVGALQAAPAVARGLVALFAARHDPACPDRAAAEAAADGLIRDGLAGVAAINDDRLLRRYRALVEAILRTNAFAPPGREALAFKLDSALVPGLPKPVPWREIFVCSRRVEGVHLRAGPVARGGIRWSDRRDDFRTEILGLMKAQRVKNAVIVPTGAKGGFYPKQLPDPKADREGWLAEGRESYRTFIRALLSMTDTIAGDAVVHPAGVVVRDGEDPYFVVAADKGTATFSDTANALAAEAGFWLDDAFASGGSKGYDHKAMGITARGAWISVQRHFAERGIDVQADPVRVAGCGDMSGDVFGNGLLLSKAVRLVAAFDHRHVFLDPAPDPAASWAERKRLFGLPRSSWDDYDRALISPGGGVFPRSQKAIPLSPEVRGLLGLDAAECDPDTLVSAILRSPVDLLWFGGIGTFVKASAQSHADVGDPANDAVRVDAREVRARVVGEGANLGFTQGARIEYALAGAGGAGGRINTDFIDNSAGVDCSDKEVNIKIALAAAKRAGRLDEEGRVALLAEMTDDVAALVLEDNRLQALALSIAEAGGPAAVAAQSRTIDRLEAAGRLDRATEGLAAADVLARRAGDGRGLTRPELAVLLASAKLALQDDVGHAALSADPSLEDELLAAFPRAMQERFADDIRGHRLRREIVATRIANRIVNRMGPVRPFELAEEEAADPARVATAFVVAGRLFGMAETWRAIETAAMPEAARILLFERAAAALHGHMADLLRAGTCALPVDRAVAELAPGIARLSGALDGLVGTEARARSARLREELAAAGAPEAEAALVARLFDLDGAVGIARLAADSARDAGELARAFVDLGTRLGLDWAQAAAVGLAPADPWDRLLAAGLARDFQQMRLDFLRGLLASGGDPAPALDRWAAGQAEPVAGLRETVARAREALAVTPAMLARIAGQARGVLARG